MHNRKLVAILGSPRRQGFTALMLECALDAARKQGWETAQINL